MGEFLGGRPEYSASERAGWTSTAQAWYSTHRTNPAQSRVLAEWTGWQLQFENPGKTRVRALFDDAWPRFILHPELRFGLAKALLQLAKDYQQEACLAQDFDHMIENCGLPQGREYLSPTDPDYFFKKYSYFDAGIELILLIREIYPEIYRNEEMPTAYAALVSSDGGIIASSFQKLAEEISAHRWPRRLDQAMRNTVLTIGNRTLRHQNVLSDKEIGALLTLKTSFDQRWKKS
ncbi:MAG: hypothetical protein HY540_05965 [Deltaproteobacteria bacterium]|nr:hypothetical protein [Deltaproteobacteria bacterium]